MGSEPRSVLQGHFLRSRSAGGDRFCAARVRIGDKTRSSDVQMCLALGAETCVVTSKSSALQSACQTPSVIPASRARRSFKSGVLTKAHPSVQLPLTENVSEKK